MKQINQNIVGFALRYRDDNTIAGYATGVIEDNVYHILALADNTLNEGIVNISVVYVDYKTSYTVVRDAQTDLNQLINNNKAILENNLLCVAALSMCDKAGVIVPANFRQSLVALQTRLTKRNSALKSSGMVQHTNEGTSPDMSVYNDKLQQFINAPGIGLVITTTSLIIAGVIALASAAAAYALFKRLNSESKADFKFSNDLTADLIKYLPGPVYEQLVKENAANAKKAQQAIDSASGKSFFTTAKYLAVGFLGFWAIDKFLQNRK